MNQRIAAAGKLDSIDLVEDSKISSFCLKPTRYLCDGIFIPFTCPEFPAPNPQGVPDGPNAGRRGKALTDESAGSCVERNIVNSSLTRAAPLVRHRRGNADICTDPA
jgi:hypothetical protein